MREWRLNSIASRIAITMMVTVVLSITVTVTLIIGGQYWMERRDPGTAPGDSRVWFDRFGVQKLNRRNPMIFLSPRMTVITQMVDMASPADRAVLMSTLATATFRPEIRDQPSLPPRLPPTSLLSRLHDVIEFESRRSPDEVRIAVLKTAARNSDVAAPSELQIEIALRDGKWLAVTTSDFKLEPPLPAGVGWMLLFGPLLLLVSLMSLWMARRLARPISAFATAAERFGMGAEAVPLPERGPREVRTAIRAFNRMQERLRRFIDDRTQMVAAMSHDLKTPLTRLRLRAELIRNEAQRRKMLTDMDAMTAMIESTLAFVRDDTKREAPLLVDLGALVESACENAMDTGGRIEVTAKQGVNITCRPIAISRAVANLIDNAIKYGGCARVRLDCDGERAIVTIDDDGPGIPEDEREKVFAPFYRLEGSRNRDTGGVGLGLAVARTAAREHGGDVTLDSAASGGLRARLELPVSSAAALPDLSSGQILLGEKAYA
ncbi:ATP-binding protein [Bradyrhizobium sp.]|uniref:ATP-binding protein n=1 Tax=Bradyrhizobium sp. TaxID=376 RepID=UPI0025BBF737|nr:ATP-binding protein [Bradyrhizobium sp.]MBV8917412.1 HAMP domain-containing protein [Bradyrhizobium sp.]